MNRLSYRIVFNTKRGQLVAVAESATSQGKSCGERAMRTSGASLRQTIQSVLRIGPLSVLALASFLAAQPAAFAQIIADPTAPANQRPTVLTDSAGRPLINIQTPSAAGLSRNTYRQFDVSTSGIVLNNASSNPWLSNGVLARTILNEVNSTSQSFINGAITVNGAGAQVIVANPNGITVNGGSFINANRATLTTGAAQVSGGTLTGFDVRGGTVTIGAGGLNNSATPYTDIVSRAMVLTGQLRAQSLGITSGLQNVAYDTGLISNQDTNTYSSGALAIDTASLGGMYAGNISILATEAGVGVRNQGTWQATGGQIVVTADGFLQNQGAVQANVASLATVKGNIDNSGSLQGSQVVVMNAGGNANLSGTGMVQTAGSAVLISAKGDVGVLGKVSSKAAGGQVSVSAGKNVYMSYGHEIAADKDVQLFSDGTVKMMGTVASSTGNVTVLGGSGIYVSYANVSGQQVHLETGAAFKSTAAPLNVSSYSTVSSTNQTTLIATGDVRLSGSGFLTAVRSLGNVHVQADAKVDIDPGTGVTAGQHMSVKAGSALSLSAAARLSAAGNMLVAGKTVSVQGSSLNAGADLSIEAKDSASLSAITSGANVANNVVLTAGKDLNVSVFNGGLYAGGLNATGQNISIVSNGYVSMAWASYYDGSVRGIAGSAKLNARDDLTIGSINQPAKAYGGDVLVYGADLTAGGRVKVFSNALASVSNAPYSANTAYNNITAGSVAIQGGSVQLTNTNLTVSGDNSGSAKSGDIAVIATNGSANLSSLTNTATGNIAWHAKGDLSISSTTALAEKSVSSGSATGEIRTSGARLTAKDMLSFSSKGSQSHGYGTLQGGAASVYTEVGDISVPYTTLKAVGTTNNNLWAVSGKLSIEAGGAVNLNSYHTLDASNDLSIVMGRGDININYGLQDTVKLNQLRYGRDLTLATRNGNMNFGGADGTVGNTSRVWIDAPGGINLVANNIYLKGSQLLARGGDFNITATTGTLKIEANKASQSSQGFINTYWDKAWLYSPGKSTTVLAGNSYLTWTNNYDINLRSLGEMNLNGLQAETTGRINFQSGDNLTISGNVNRWQVDNRPSAGSGFNGWYQDEEWVDYSSIVGRNGVSLGAMGGNLRLNGTRVSAAWGTASLQALGRVSLEAVMTDKVHSATSYGWDQTWYGKKTTWTTYHDRAWRDVNPVYVNARDIAIKAGNNVETYATNLNASNNLRIEAGDQALYYAVANQTDHRDTTYKKSSWIGIRYDKSTEYNTTRISTPMVSTLYATGGNLTSYSGGDQLFQGTKATYYSRDIQAGVGEKARADARIILEGVKTEVFQQRTKESNYVVWQKQINQGSNTETLTLPSFTGQVNTPFSAPGGISVQIPAGELTSQIAALSQQPGMGYLSELAARTDVNWQPVKLAHDQWNYKQEGLTPAGAALLSVAVAWATGGMGAELLGTTGSTTSLAANAAFSSIASQAAVTLVNNKGNIGKTLSDLAKSDFIKSALVAAITAGVLDKVASLDSMKALKTSAAFTDKLTYNLINASGRALTNTALTGGSLEDALKGAIIGGIVDTAHGEVASQIKGLEADYLAHKLAHALAGCVAGALAQGTCRDGAIGAAVGEAVAEIFKGEKPGIYATEAERTSFDQKVLAISKLAAGAASAYSGGNALTAITTAETAILNNFLTFDENQLRKDASAACKAGNAQACSDEKRLDQTDVNRDEKMKQVCTTSPSSQSCTDWRNFALLARSSYSNKTNGLDAILDLIKNGKYSDIQELQSIQRLLATTPYAYGKDINLPPHMKTLVSIVADLTPIIGDVKAFYEAQDPFDYAIAMLGTLGPVGDSAAAAIRGAKAAHLAGDVSKAESLLSDARLVTRNHVNGWVFETSGLKLMGLDKNKYRINTVNRNGDALTIVPDAIIGGINGTFVEFKNVINITNTDQFRGYAATGTPVILVISPRTQTISETVWRSVTGNGKVFRVDPATGIKTELLARPGA